MTSIIDCQAQTKELSTEFDWEIYIQCNQGIKNLSDRDSAYNHWLEIGQSKNFIATEEQFYKSYGFDRQVLPLDFDWKEYLEINEDVERKLGLKKWLAFKHFFRCGLQEQRVYSFQAFGEICLKKNNYLKALKAFKSAIEKEKHSHNLNLLLNAERIESYIALLEILFDKNLRMEAIDFYKYLLQSYDNDPCLCEQIEAKIGSNNVAILLTGFEDPAIASQVKSIDFYAAYRDDLKETEEDNTDSELEIVQAAAVSPAYRADIVVCVYNALEDVTHCLNSIIKNTTVAYQLIIIDDCSQTETSEFLKQWAIDYSHVTLIRHSTNLGYTKTANRGLRTAQSDYITLLNSDTIVTPRWLEKLIDCAESDKNIGVVGPLSNCASWQSVPDLFNDDRDWALNPIPEPYSIDEFSDLVESLSEGSFPKVAFVNGFCYMLTRKALNAVGFLDEKAFPHGYGEENDLSLRILKAGFKLVIDDRTYIYHAKSKSFGHQTRQQLAARGSIAVKRKHADLDLESLTQSIRYCQTLQQLRLRIKERLNQYEQLPILTFTS
jgi:GT2 family glycosyltransferase